MNFITKLGTFFGFSKKVPENANLQLSLKNEKRQGVRRFIERQYIGKAEMQIQNWEDAILAAKDPEMPTREELYMLYAWTMLDAHLFSQIRTAHITVQRSTFEVQQDGQIDEDATNLLKRPWFVQYLKHALDAEFWGHSLIEFDFDKKDGEFQRIYLIPREHVKPETKQVLILPSDEDGFNYSEGDIANWVVEVGDDYDLGLLEIATREIVYKTFARKDWSIRSEKYGMPTLIIKTATSDEKELDAKENMAQNIGSNGYAIIDTSDEHELLESKSTSGHEIYKDKAAYCDENISKLINGQTGTSDQKSFVGSAQVHERILNDYGYSRLRRLQYHINFVLFPFLIKHGYAFDGKRFSFKDLEMRPDEDDKKQDSEKKKLGMRF